MRHKPSIYTYHKSITDYRGISPDNFADQKIHGMSFIQDKITNLN